MIAGLFVTAPAFAQMTPEDLADTGPASPEVQRAIAWEGVQDEIIYLRPSADFKPSERVRITVPEKPTESATVSRPAVGLIAAIIVGVIVWLFIRFGNKVSVTLGTTRDDRRRQQREGADGPVYVLPEHGALDHIAAMADRRAALILLTGHALQRAATANGMKLARAQTARDVLRALPRQWRHMPALRQIVRLAEIVHFGGRDLEEDAWQNCLTAARPIFSGEAAT